MQCSAVLPTAPLRGEMIMIIGVLALQGAFTEHVVMLARLGVPSREVRKKQDLAGLDGLIIPGGESTAVGKLASSGHSGYLLDELRMVAQEGLAIYGTCAGMVLLARDVLDGVEGQPRLAVMDITVRRNVFGRQIDSFLIPISIPALDMIGETSEKGVPFPAVFIRAPRIEKAGEDVDTLAMLDDGTIVAARQDNTLVSSFHPELTDDTRFHEYFVAMVRGRV